MCNTFPDHLAGHPNGVSDEYGDQQIFCDRHDLTHRDLAQSARAAKKAIAPARHLLADDRPYTPAIMTDIYGHPQSEAPPRLTGRSERP